MNYIYKTNRYKLSLLIIIDINALEELFYVIFYFLAIENFENYF